MPHHFLYCNLKINIVILYNTEKSWLDKTIMIKSEVKNDIGHHENCVMCGTANPHSLRLKFSSDTDGNVYSQFSGNIYLQGYPGILHGGVIGSLLDSAMTNCLFNKKIEAVTGELTIKFHQSIPCDAKLDIKANVKSDMNPLYVVQAIIQWQGKLMASSEAKFMRKN